MAEGVSLSYIPVVKIFSLVSIQKNMSIGRLYINHLCLVGAPLHPCINGCSIPRIWIQDIKFVNTRLWPPYSRSSPKHQQRTISSLESHLVVLLGPSWNGLPYLCTGRHEYPDFLIPEFRGIFSLAEARSAGNSCHFFLVHRHIIKKPKGVHHSPDQHLKIMNCPRLWIPFRLL